VYIVCKHDHEIMMNADQAESIRIDDCDIVIEMSSQLSTRIEYESYEQAITAFRKIQDGIKRKEGLIHI